MNRLPIQHQTPTWQAVAIGAGLTLLATFSFEHSTVDIGFSQLFYLHGQWLLGKHEQPYALLLYRLPKALLIVLVVYLLAARLQRVVVRFAQPLARLFRPVRKLSNTDLWYLVTALVIVPSITATLKAFTHVTCPNHLLLFGGDMPYLTLWQSLQISNHAKCFPAAHASSGFALYAWAFVPLLWRWRWQIVTAVTLGGWLMGLYKIAIGDHFFSHTAVAMLLAWTLCAALARVFYR